VDVLPSDYADQDCLLARALEAVGERWTLLIVRDAFFGVRRFSDFLLHLDIPKAVLSQRLKGLVADGILERRPDPGRTSREVYELTQAGLDLWPAIFALRSWAARYRTLDETRRAFTHFVCGAELAQDGSCPTCQTTPPAGDIVMSLRPGAGRRRDDPVTIALLEPHRLLEPLAR
jgi:DNA-binding HxlR family transcriptional regulator